MAGQLQGKRIAIIAADGVERVELDTPRQAVQEAGAQTEVISIHDGEIDARNHDLEEAGSIPVDRVVGDVSVDDYDALLMPGGTVNPDKLRLSGDAVRFVHDFVASNKPVGVICHGPWTLINAGVVEGLRITAWPTVRVDLRNAGADVVDQEVVVDQGIVSSRNPNDLPEFCDRIVEEFAAGVHSDRHVGAAMAV